MNRESLFHRSVEVLVNAYNGGTLEHGDCKACAVGNLVSAAKGAVGEQWFNPVFQVAMKTLTIGGVQLDQTLCDYIERQYEGEEALTEIAATGYSFYEIVQIERAFESKIGEDVVNEIEKGGKPGMHGLRAVYDVLMQIHEVEVETVAKAEEVFA